MSDGGSNIRVTYTAYCIDGWEQIFTEHMQRLQQHLFSHYPAALRVFAFPYNDRITEIINASGISGPTSVRFVEKNEYEFPALRDILSDPADKNLYMHTKGVTRSSRFPNVTLWNDYMTHFCVDRCSACIDALDHYSCAGCEFHKIPWPHYSGNFWWCTRDHASRLRDVVYDTILHSTDRYDAERMIGRVPGTFLSLAESGKNLYEQSYTQDEWKEDPRVFTLG